MELFSIRNKNEASSPLNMSKLDFSFILAICLVTTFLILILAHPNSLDSIDECYYLHLGKCVVDGSDYYHGFPDGRPIIPSIIALFLYLGFDLVAVRVLIPIIFMNLALISTYALGKTLFGRKEAFIATLFLFSFPFFWGLCTMHVDIPLTVFTTLFLLFFYLGIEKEIKFLPISAIFISIALLTKMTAVLILISAIFYLIIRRKWDICRKKEFLISAMIIPLLFFSVYAIFHVLMSATMDFSQTKGGIGATYRPFEIFRLGFAPVLIFTIFSISKEKRAVYLWLAVLTSILFWALFTNKIFFIRHLTPLFPLVGILIATGFLKFKTNYFNRKSAYIIFSILLCISFVHAVYLVSYHNDTGWGIETLSDRVKQLEGNGKIAIDEPSIGYYLKASTSKDIIRSYTHTFNITDEWIRENNIDFIILSVYGDRVRTKSNCYVHPKYLMIEIPFVEIYDPGKLPQSNYQFQSELYNLCENRYEKVEEIYKGEQKVFIIYKILGLGTEMALKFEAKKGLAFIIAALLLTDLAILLDIPALRQIFGFLCFTIIPGLLILYALKLDKLGFTEKFILSLGLGISFLMLFGLFIDNLYFSLGYETPLSTISVVVSFSVAMIFFCIIGYKTNKEAFSFAIPDLNLSKSEKAFLSVPILFPALSIFGMYVMNTTDNNIILMFLLFLIPIYVAFVCFYNQKFSNRLYPVVIFLISISILLLLSLRSNYILGADIHIEYYYFRTTLSNLHWRILGPALGFGHSVLDACLAISLLPTIGQSILNVNTQYIYKLFYSLAFSVSPLIVYVISKKYVEERYAFLASMFFMSQLNFFRTIASPRTALAALFFSLAIMTLFSDKIDPIKKRILFIAFIASCIVSHYSTAYVFFLVMLGVFVGVEILSKKYTFKKVVSLTIMVLFFALIFLWYSQVTEAAFNAGVHFFEKTFINLNELFLVESRGGQVQALYGKDIAQKGIPHQIQFVFTWLTFVFIAFGIIELIRRYKEMSFPELKFKKPEFLKDKFEVLYFMFALVCAGLLVAVLVIPYVSRGYSITRVYTNIVTILSVFFVIGGILIAKYLNQALAALSTRSEPMHNGGIEGTKGTKSHLKKSDKKHFVSESVNGGKASEVLVYLVILVVLIPSFLCNSGVMYNLFGVPRPIILNSEGEEYDEMYMYRQDSCGVKWLKEYIADQEVPIYADHYGFYFLVSQGRISPHQINPRGSFVERYQELGKVNGYIYLRYLNVIKGELLIDKSYNMTDYPGMFDGKNKVYANGGSEIYE